MIPVADPFMAGVRPTGLQRGRGGFLRSADDAPYVSDPSGETVKTGERKGEVKRLKYGSPSNRGREIENDAALVKYRQRLSFLGIGMDTALAEACRDLALMDADSDEFKHAADKIAVEADKLTRSWLAADRGTHGHLLCELRDRMEPFTPAHCAAGEAVGLPQRTQDDVVFAWSDMLRDNALEILAIEASCVDDTWRLAGTLDRIIRLTKPLTFVKPGGELVTIPAGTVLVLDIKFGKTRKAHPIQIASYAQSVPYDTDTETRGEWPWQIDQTHALIAHGDFGDEFRPPSIELVWVDLVAGREHGGQCVVDAKAWAARDDVFSISQINSPAVTTCTVDGCEKTEMAARGLCVSHYNRWQRHGDPTAGRATYKGDGAKAFAELVELETDHCILWPYGKTNVGYGQLLVDGVNSSTHVLACEHHHGPRPTPTHEVAHSCGARDCMNYRHLRWATHAENEADKAAQGTKPIGESVGGSKLTEVDVREIRGKADILTPRALARQYGVEESTIRAILTGKTWKHVAQIVEGEAAIGDDAPGDCLVVPSPSTPSSAGMPDPSAPLTVGEEAGAAAGHSPASPRRTWYNPKLDPRLQQLKMTPAMVKAIVEQTYDDGSEKQCGPLNEPDADHPANLMSSLCEDGLHRPALDVDIPLSPQAIEHIRANTRELGMVEIVQSSSGNCHVLAESPALPLDEYLSLVALFCERGLVEAKYLEHSRVRGQTLLRLPGVPKLWNKPILTADPARLALVDARGQLCATPDEGANLSDGEFNELWDRLRTLFDALDPTARWWRSELVKAAQQRHVPFHAQVARTERTYYLNRAVISLAIYGGANDILRALLALIVGDVALFPSIHPGHVVGSLGATEAERLAALADAYVADRLIAYTDDDGSLRYREGTAPPISPPPAA